MIKALLALLAFMGAAQAQELIPFQQIPSGGPPVPAPAVAVGYNTLAVNVDYSKYAAGSYAQLTDMAPMSSYNDSGGAGDGFDQPSGKAEACAN